MSIYKKLLALQQAVVGLTKDKRGNSYPVFCSSF